MPIDILPGRVDPWPEAFRQPASSRRPYRHPNTFETVDGWVRQFLFRRIPSETLNDILQEIMIDIKENQHGPNMEEIASNYAFSVRDKIALYEDNPPDRPLHTLIEQIRGIYMRRYSQEVS
jgi:hypothetical protein